MSSKNSTGFTSNDWLSLQQQMMDVWLKSLNQANPGKAKHDTDNPMVEGMAQWWKTVSTSLPEGSEEFINKLMEQGRIYYMLGEQFANLLKVVNDTNKISGDWQEALNDQFEQMKNLFSNIYSNTDNPFGGVLGAWQQLPLDTLQRTLSFASLMPGDFLQDLKPEGLESVTDKFLSIPGVGYTREHQESIQEGIRLWNDFQKTSREYNVAMSNIGIRAFDVLRERIIAMSRKGEEITSLRQIYDLWIDCNEEVYSDFAHSDEFSRLYGRLTNALMAVKRHGRNSIDEILSALRMPTHRTLNTMQKRQQEMRREQKVNNLVIARLQEEVADLKRERKNSASRNTGKGTVAGGKNKKKKKRVAAKRSEKKAGPDKTGKGKTVVKPDSGHKTRKKNKKKTATKNEKIIIKI